MTTSRDTIIAELAALFSVGTEFYLVSADEAVAFTGVDDRLLFICGVRDAPQWFSQDYNNVDIFATLAFYALNGTGAGAVMSAAADKIRTTLRSNVKGHSWKHIEKVASRPRLVEVSGKEYRLEEHTIKIVCAH